MTLLAWSLLAACGVQRPTPEPTPEPTPAPATPPPAPAAAPADGALDLGDGVRIDLVAIPAGPVTLRQGEQRRAVEVSQPFLVGRTEVTVAQLRRWRPRWEPTLQKPRYDNVLVFDGDAHPAVVTWLEAEAFTRWASAETGRTVRLPTEAEWVRAASGGAETRFFWGEDPAMAGQYANLADPVAFEQIVRGDVGQPQDDRSLAADPHVGPAPVGSFAPNAYGLHDPIGNLMEWCQDRWTDDLSQVPADGAPVPGSSDRSNPEQRRVLRGGAFNSGPALGDLRARNYCFSNATFSSTGFRVVVEVSGPPG